MGTYMSIFWNFNWPKSSLNQFRGHTFSKIRDSIFFIGFIADFRFSTFSNFPRKKWVPKWTFLEIFLTSKNFSDQSRGHTFSKIWDLIFFIGFITDFRFPTFENFQRKIKATFNFRGNFFGFNISFRPKSWAQSLQKVHFSIFYGSGARLFIQKFLWWKKTP